MKYVIPTQHILDEKTIRKRLVAHFHDHIIISSKFRSNTVICLKKNNHEILTNTWYNQSGFDKEENEYHILKAAGAIIRRHIRTSLKKNV